MEDQIFDPKKDPDYLYYFDDRDERDRTKEIADEVKKFIVDAADAGYYPVDDLRQELTSFKDAFLQNTGLREIYNKNSYFIAEPEPAGFESADFTDEAFTDDPDAMLEALCANLQSPGEKKEKENHIDFDLPF